MPHSQLDSRQSWIVAYLAVAATSVVCGAPYVIVVALKQVASDVSGGARSVPSTANAAAWLGAAFGGLVFGWLVDRIGIRWPLVLGSIMLCLGCAISSVGSTWTLYLGHGVFIGFFGIGSVYAPLITTVSHWFSRRRGVAISLVASGQQVAGAIWPPIFGFATDHFGWKLTLLLFGGLNAAVVIPMAATKLCSPAPDSLAVELAGNPKAQHLVGLHGNTVFGILCIAIVGCCVAMAMPMTHLVAYCGDLGFSTGRGTEMLALLLGAAFVSRILWGRLSDEIGGLNSVLIGTVCQALLLAAFIPVQDFYALYILSAAFGLGFGGIVPSYVLAIRQLFPSGQAGWRIATLLFFSLSGMALGSWLGGAIFDITLDYRWAFATGVTFNVVTIVLIGFLMLGLNRHQALAL